MEAQKPVLILTVGLPGSGKSTYLGQLSVNPVSTDAIRLQLADDATDQSINGAVFATAQYLVRKRVELGRPFTYVDATNLTVKDRSYFIDLGRDLGCRMEAVYFDTPLHVCQQRNQNRARVVPPEVIAMLASRLVPPTVGEGFDAITTVVPT